MSLGTSEGLTIYFKLKSDNKVIGFGDISHSDIVKKPNSCVYLGLNFYFLE